LALHLSLAFSLFAILLWTRWEYVNGGNQREASGSFHFLAPRLLLVALVIQIILGALVAGLRAGYAYNTFPLMDGAWIPDGLYLLTPWWLNHLENVLTVQFQHRIMAYVVSAGILLYVWRAWGNLSQRRLLIWLLAALTLQFALGVFTLLSGMNIWLASAHQLGAMLLLSVLLRLIYVNARARQANMLAETKPA
jgi:cytochrome c oxidase assembly protein subunit 15